MDNFEIDIQPYAIEQPPQEPQIQAAENINEVENNAEKNKEKFFFFKFLMYNTKIELHYDIFTNTLYWTSILELAMWNIAFILFCTNTSRFASIWAFLIHVPRAVFGFIILKYIPNTFDVIENLNETDNDTIDDVQEKLYAGFGELLQAKEDIIKKYLIGYFIMTIINFIIDFAIFFYVLATWGKNGYHIMNIAEITIVVVFLMCDGTYFGWMGSLKFSFPPEMLDPIRKMALGFLGEIKTYAGELITNAKNKIMGRSSAEVQPEAQAGAQAAVQPQPE